MSDLDEPKPKPRQRIHQRVAETVRPRVRMFIWAFVRRFPVALAGFVLLGLNGRLLFVTAEQGAATLQATFAVLAGLAALCFTAAPVILEEQDHAHFVRGGERFLHAAVLALIAALLNFAIVAINASGFLNANKVIGGIVGIVFYLFVPSTYLLAAIEAHSGLVTLNRVLWDRHDRFGHDERWA